MDDGELFLHIIVAITFIFIGFFIYIRYLYTYFDRLKVPSVWVPLFPFGHVEEYLAGRCTWCQQIWQFYTKCRRKKQQFCGVFLSIQPCLLYVDPKLIHLLLTTYKDHFEEKSLSNFTGKTRPRQYIREQLFEFLTSDKVNKVLNAVIEDSAKIDHSLEVFAQNHYTTNLSDFTEKYVINNAASAILGIFCTHLSNNDVQIYKYSKTLIEKNWSPSFTQQALGRCKCLDVLFGQKQYGQEVRSFLKILADQALRSRLEGTARRADVLQFVIDSMQTIDAADLPKFFEEFEEYCIDFFAHNVERCFALVTFCIYELGLTQNKLHQDKVREEIQAYPQDSLTVDNVRDMEFLEQVILETLRKYPPNSTVYKVCKNEVRDEKLKLKITTGQHVLLPVYGVHYDSECHDTPGMYCPFRFSKRRLEPPIPEVVYLTQIGLEFEDYEGLNFTKTLSKILLVSLLRNYEYHVPDNEYDGLIMYLENGFSLLPEKEIIVNVKKIPSNIRAELF